MLYITVSPTQRWKVVASDFTMSNSATSPVSITSIPQVSHHVTGRQILNESGIRTGDSRRERERERERKDTRGPFSLALAKAAEPDRT
ncbi:hypothetical protein E2C01_027322 [Portunus trituberculatus]|uniref:Uncharacterized protein n=1 Tax=Portunus trituberculatus TaxID=210409 RepID=A0A5B7EIF3_PORTR|nr:hypothetical protein [Portunus trituberculatus]